MSECAYCEAFQWRDWQTVEHMQDNGQGCTCPPEPFDPPLSLICAKCSKDFPSAGELNARAEGDGTIIVSCPFCERDMATFQCSA